MTGHSSPPDDRDPTVRAAAPAASVDFGSEAGEETLTPLEREVLEEYVKLRDNLDQLSPLLSDLATRPTPAILDTLRILERKTSLASTLLKASVYSIVLQQEMFEGNGDQSEGQSEDRSHGH